MTLQMKKCAALGIKDTVTEGESDYFLVNEYPLSLYGVENTKILLVLFFGREAAAIRETIEKDPDTKSVWKLVPSRYNTGLTMRD